MKTRPHHTSAHNVLARQGRPRDERIDDAVLKATHEILEERGFGGLSIAAIAERAGTTPPAIYRRWRSKGDLVLQTVFATEGIDTVADTGDLEVEIRLMVRWTLQKLSNPIGRAALAGLLSAPHSAQRPPSGALASLWERQGQFVQARIDRGVLRADLTTDAFVAVLVGPAMYAATVLGVGPDDDHWVDQLVQTVLRSIRPPATEMRDHNQ